MSSNPSFKKNELEVYKTTRMNLRITMLNEIIQKKSTYSLVSFVYTSRKFKSRKLFYKWSKLGLLHLHSYNLKSSLTQIY